ncbi:peptide-methionine (R)-S-oxide reductase MsrB, partial [Acinetobacter johnsonii]
MFNWESINNYLDNGTPAPPRKVEKSEEEWKKILTPAQFNVMRKKGTERPHTGELCSFYEAGRYACAGCDTELFDSNVKFDSGTGWPSFSEPVADNVIQYELDTTYGRRIEVLCNVCEAHLGHVFPDGPEPSGARFCINSES